MKEEPILKRDTFFKAYYRLFAYYGNFNVVWASTWKCISKKNNNSTSESAAQRNSDVCASSPPLLPPIVFEGHHQGFVQVFVSIPKTPLLHTRSNQRRWKKKKKLAKPTLPGCITCALVLRRCKSEKGYGFIMHSLDITPRGINVCLLLSFFFFKSDYIFIICIYFNVQYW